MIRRFLLRIVSPLDGFLLSTATLLMLLGLVVLYSASGEDLSRVLDQTRNILVALAVMWLAANVPPHQLMRLAVPAYLVGVALLLAVALFGEVSHGARRWLHLGFTRIQPSELMKIAIPLTLAWYFQRHEHNQRLLDFVVATALLVVPVYLVARQPDLGTALIIFLSGFYVLFLAGLSWTILGGVAVALGLSVPLVWPLLHEYQRRRVLTLFDPNQDPLGAGYHTIQSTIALGSGGSTGKGWLNGTQSHLDFLPERTTDFIFAVFGEEFGLLGAALLVTLLLILTARGVAIASNSTTTFSRLVAGALTFTVFTYAFVNIGMVSGILPVVGVPLPFMSYGGTSMVTLLLGLGILMSIQYHKRLMRK
jgi:rod shape determining protein RodA